MTDSEATVREITPLAAEAERAPTRDAALSRTEESRQNQTASRRRIVILVYGIAGGLGLALVLVDGDWRVKAFLCASIGLSVVMVTWLWHLAEQPTRYSNHKLGIVWCGCAGAVCLSWLYLGVFSLAPPVMVLGICFISLGQSRTVAAAVYALCAGFHALAGGLIAAGVVIDPGLLPSRLSPSRDLVVATATVQVILLAAYLLGRWARQATVARAIELTRAFRSIAQQDVLLREARQDIDRALGAGRPRHMSGQSVGSFRLGAVLGRGAMGEVYEAVHLDSGESAAVKLLGPHVCNDRICLARFLREIVVAAALESPHVVRVLEVGDETAEVPYLAMEMLRGQDLGALLRDRSRLEPSEVAELVGQVGRGVDAAANAGIVHRDLKPQNLFLVGGDAEPRIWKVLDFGVCALANRGGTLTQGRVIGTPAYMPPEQAQGRDVDRRADVYALAAISYRALTGFQPFCVRGGLAAVVYAIVNSMPRRPSDLAPLPAQVDDILLLGLAKNPNDRFDCAADFADAFAAAVAGRLQRSQCERAEQLSRQHPWQRLEWAQPSALWRSPGCYSA